MRTKSHAWQLYWLITLPFLAPMLVIALWIVDFFYIEKGTGRTLLLDHMIGGYLLGVNHKSKG